MYQSTKCIEAEANTWNTTLPASETMSFVAIHISRLLPGTENGNKPAKIINELYGKLKGTLAAVMMTEMLTAKSFTNEWTKMNRIPNYLMSNNGQ